MDSKILNGDKNSSRKKIEITEKVKLGQKNRIKTQNRITKIHKNLAIKRNEKYFSLDIRISGAR